MEQLNQNLPEIPVEQTTLERITNSVLLKMVVIFFLILIMLIPMSLVQDLVNERQLREQNVISEIASKWGKEQVITSPILAVPYDIVTESLRKDSKGKEYNEISIDESWVYLLPENDKMAIDVSPEHLKRGIYQSVVYNSTSKINGDYKGFDENKLPIEANKLKWQQAKMIMGVQDLKGLLSNPKLSINNVAYEFQKSNHEFNLFPNTFVADLKLENLAASKFNFKIDIELRGSKSINILPLANQSEIAAKGNWGNPSFNGGYLPEDRQVDEKAFEAKWSIPSFARKTPQQWNNNDQAIYNFNGVNLIESDNLEYSVPVESSTTSIAGIASDADMVQINFLPEVNNYQKATRATKYGILIIILTFVSLFFTEIIKKERIHLIQYLLIGVAMVLFYSLLIAFSEHFGFNWAYLVAGISTILLIATFIKAITKNNKTALLFTGILGLFYTFIYVLMQLRDYSLLVGTIGVFVILAVLMRISTKVNWYQFDRK